MNKGWLELESDPGNVFPDLDNQIFMKMIMPEMEYIHLM